MGITVVELESKTFYSQRARALLLVRLRRENVNVNHLSIVGFVGKPTDLHTVYVSIFPKKNEAGQYIEKNAGVRQTLMSTVRQLIAQYHWSLGQVQNRGGLERLIYYWPSNLTIAE